MLPRTGLGQEEERALKRGGESQGCTSLELLRGFLVSKRDLPCWVCPARCKRHALLGNISIFKEFHHILHLAVAVGEGVVCSSQEKYPRSGAGIPPLKARG